MEFPHSADITIIGKHTNAYHFLHAIKGTTIGLNQAALAHKTDFAMTGHEAIMTMLKATPYYPERVISLTPMFEQTNHPTKYRIGNLQDRGTIERKRYTYEQVLSYVQIANTQGIKAKYPNWWTILHPAIFFAVAHHPKSITIIGCDNTPAPHNPYPDMIHHSYARQHTGRMVKACREIGIQCDWLTIPETIV